jgi:glutathione synthase/RimK-type ligase-like ATP-grasp enzyme
MNDNKPFFKILDELCEEKGIKQEKISFGWIRKLTKNNESHSLVRYEFDLNSAVSYEIAKDKYATYAMLKNNSVPIIEHSVVFNPVSRSEYFDENFRLILELNLRKYGKLVIKANDSCKGEDVYVFENVLDGIAIIEKLFKEGNPLVDICPYIDIKYEYRAVYLDGEIIYLYKKQKPSVIGDGVKTLEELIKEKEETVEMPIEIIPDLNLKYVPKENEQIIISWKHNLSSGAEAIKVDSSDENYDKIIELAVKAGKSIGIRFASVDVVLENETDELMIMEINGSVCMNKFSETVENGYEIAKEIYSKALDKMFNIDDM